MDVFILAMGRESRLAGALMSRARVPEKANLRMHNLRGNVGSELASLLHATIGSEHERMGDES
jgi:hypothetical protein